MDFVIASYENYKEEDRLTTDQARKVEFLTTVRVLGEWLPPGGSILDCAAGSGIYSFHYAERGYDVTVTDITPRHIDYINRNLIGKPFSITTAVQDATDLSGFADESFDVVLCMGPFYHLTEKTMREKCMAECRRVAKTGGLVVVSYISRFYVMAYVAASNNEYLDARLTRQVTETGVMLHDDPLCFWTDNYFSTPDEMEAIVCEAGMSLVDHFGQDGISPLLRSTVNGLNEEQFQVWCDYHYTICREKSILGASNHGVVVGRK